MSKLNGYAVIAKVGSASSSTTKIPAQTDSTIELTTEKEDTTTKDASVDQTTGYLFPEEEVTSVKGVITVTCLKDDTTANGVKIGTTVYWTFVSGGDTYAGQATVDRLREGGNVKGKATLELTLNTVGAISGIS